MPQKYPSKPREQQELAERAVDKYFKAAERFFKEDKETANDCAREARRVAMKFKVRIPSKYKRRFCKKCLSYLVPGVNCRVRLHKKNVITYCFKCKNVMKVGYRAIDEDFKAADDVVSDVNASRKRAKSEFVSHEEMRKEFG